MTDHTVSHATFVVERTYPASPQRVFAAWSEPAAKARWFGSPDEGTQEFGMEFKVHGREWSRGKAPTGETFVYEARYSNIVPNERIVYTYEMHHRGVKLSVSLATFELEPEGEGTLLTLTEHGVYLDGHEDPALREQGTRMLFDQLAAYVGRVRA